MNISKTLFGKLPGGAEVFLFKLSNDNGVEVSVTNYGAIVTSVITPDKQGHPANIVCGFDKLEDYLSAAYLGNYPYFGAICGRVANRIAKGRFTLDGKDYQLAINNGPNHLHGGITGFDRRLWHPEMLQSEGKVGVMMTYLSPDGEENYPGNLEIGCIYSLNNDNELIIDYFASTDQTTIVNLTNHSYFNLTGGQTNILEHELQLNASKITESTDLIPTGNLIPVAGTPFDFTSAKPLGKDIGQLETGYDLNYVLDNDAGKLVWAGCLSEKTSGRKVEVFTTQPGIQLYTGYWIPELIIEGVKRFGSYAGVALETQHYPDSVNQPAFPPVILTPDQKFTEQTIYRFGITE